MLLLQLLFLFAVFLCVFYIPGYACAILVGCPRRILDLKTFTFSVLLGMAIVTLVTYYLSLLFGFGTLTILISSALVAGTAFTITAIRQRRQPVLQSELSDSTWDAIRPPKLLWVVLIVVVGLVYFSQQIITVGNHTYFPEAARDFFVRIEMVNSILDTGVPPRNTFASVGPQPTMANQYFFYLFCAILSRLTSLPATGTWSFMVAVAAGLFLLSAFLFVRKYFGSDKHAALFLVIAFIAGLDLIMMASRTFVLRILSEPVSYPFHIDYWAGTPHVPLLTRMLLWAPHHVLAVTLSFVIMILMDNADSWLPLRNVVIALALTALVSISVNSGLVFAIGLVVFTVWTFYQRRWLDLWRLFFIGTLTAILLLPFLRELVLNSTQSQLSFGLRSVETIWGGAVFRFVLGANLFTQILDVLVHFALEFGILLLLAFLGLRQTLKQPSHILLNVMILAYAGASLLVMVFMRSPYEAFASQGAVPFQFVVAIYATIWLIGAFRERKLPKLVQGLLIFMLIVQFSASVYSIAWDLGARFLPGIGQETSRRQYEEIQITAQMEAVIQKSSYRLQVMPPWNNIGNSGINTHIPAFSDRAQVLYVADGALAYGLDRPQMEKYFYGLCAIYSGDTQTLAQELASFDSTSVTQDSPWYYYMTIAWRCFQGVNTLSPEAFSRFVRDFKVDYVLIEPDDTIFKKGLPALQAKGIVEVIPLKYGYYLLKIVEEKRLSD